MKSGVPFEELLIDRIHEEDLLEVPVESRLFRVFLAVCCVIVGIVVVQLFVLGVLKGDFYSARAAANMSDIRIERAPRGLILDRFGDVLVRNEPLYRAFLLPRFLPQDTAERYRILSELRKALGLSEDDFFSRVTEEELNAYEELLLSPRLSREELVRLTELAEPWLKLEPAFSRVPTDALVFSHLAGYTGFPSETDIEADPDLSPHDEVGKDGLELMYDSVLRGVSGKEVAFRNAQGGNEGFQRVREARGGEDLQTFIDGELQRYFYESLGSSLERLGRTTAVGIAIDPRNGEVLSLVGFPSFDASRVSDFLAAPDDPLFNRAVSGLYNPGSTIKPLHAVAALAEGVISPFQEIYSGGDLELPNPYTPSQPSRFNDTKVHGLVDVRSALARSSNVYFYTVGGGFGGQEGLGIERLKRWWELFRLNQKTGIDLPGEQVGVLPDPQWKKEVMGEDWRIGDTYHVSIGQGDLLVTPIGLASYVSAIANGGVFFEPHIVKRARGTGNAEETIVHPKPLSDIRDMIRDVVPYVQEGMEDVAAKPYGTAYSLSSLPFPVAAKTGTAQVAQNTKVNAFFIGYAPADDPKIALAILIENAREGSANTIPVAREVLLWFYENRILKAGLEQ